ncbi:sulfite reductase subunit alpha [Parvularcula flava]|uniref:Sulfite reductase [NADPH] flavoprotein alpha-component n=1 Tax=Aquisalinus luteolus TaxID=1566827 RepID=A0A8J3EQ20_9PROT|nr:sulfite reductase subunit alpha [Aquisalinus luteolus]NHK26848.1 sulfite reductase subunit alpha [Aquisalinus luteolus]GGH93595.1 sulfite reductase [NADPH] flavoprotein alpha-component [Aquisalinus luteolus]
MGEQNHKLFANTLFFPEEAPFSPDQKAWLNGYFAGLNSRLAQIEDAAPTQALKPVHILYGSQTGNAESVAEEVAENASQFGLAPHVMALDDIEIADLKKMERVLICVSTYGEGEMPDNAQLFWDAILSQTAPRLEKTHYAVLALGDTSYDEFCQAGKLIDLRLEQLGAYRIADRVDCDVDYEDKAAEWLGSALPEISKFGKDAPTAGVPEASKDVPVGEAKSKRAKWNRKNPYTSVLATNRLLSAEGSAKEIRHFEFALGDSEIEYEAGDALGVMPVNDPELVEATIKRLGYNPDADAGDGKSLREALTTDYEISMPSRDYLTAVAAQAEDSRLSHIVDNNDKEAIDDYLWSKDQLDLLNLYPVVTWDLEQYLDLLKPLQHRAYSISSSPKADPDHIHLTVASVRYDSHGRQHGGVCSTFMADRVGDQGTAGIFLSPNKAFRLPSDLDAPVIMVGPGTGIAPFRAFLQDREAAGAKGKNWLFFGDQKRKSDFIYEQEMLDWHDKGVLTKLDLAFSRDQEEKIYVQQRMKENGAELFKWLEEGAYFYVCGDATRMAKDVDAALLKIIEKEAGINDDAAWDYVGKMKKDKRYLRDVY